MAAAEGALPDVAPGNTSMPVPPAESPFSDDPVEHSNWSATFMVSIMVAWLIFGHKIQGMFHWARWISEGSMACLLGVLSGVFLLIWDVFHANYVHKSLSFDSAAFFTYMLPPIIFYGGLAIERRLFVSNLLSILAFGVLGTFISFSILGATLYWLSLLPNVLSVSDCFSLAAIFAATDSVAVLQVLRPESHPALYSIVLGEGVLNDATSVALLRSVPAPGDAVGDGGALTAATLARMLTFFLYVFAASCALGASSGLAIAATIKHLGPFSQPQEVALVGALAFLSYLLADLAGLSGILSLFFCGMAVSHYALQHVSRPSRAALLNAFATLSYLLEGLIFLYVGRDALDPVKWANARFVQTMVLVVVIALLVAVSRAIFVFPMAWLHNRWSDKTITMKDSIVVWWAGMMRGAVSVAMVYYRFDPRNEKADKHAATIVVTTLQLVLYSTVGLGGLTGPLLKYLLPTQVKPPDVTGAQLHGNGPDDAGSFARLHRTGSSPSLDDDWNRTLLPLQRRGSSRYGSGDVFGGATASSPPASAGLGGLFNTSSHAPVARSAEAAEAQPSGIELGVASGAMAPSNSLDTRRGSNGRSQQSASAAIATAVAGAASAISPPAAGTAAASPLPGLAGASSSADAAVAARAPVLGKAAATGVGTKVMDAAHSFAAMTDFEGTSSKSASLAGGADRGSAALGSAVFNRLKRFDRHYLQPVFGRDGASLELLEGHEGRKEEDSKDEPAPT